MSALCVLYDTLCVCVSVCMSILCVLYETDSVCECVCVCVCVYLMCNVL